MARMPHRAACGTERVVAANTTPMGHTKVSVNYCTLPEHDIHWARTELRSAIRGYILTKYPPNLALVHVSKYLRPYCIWPGTQIVSHAKPNVI